MSLHPARRTPTLVPLLVLAVTAVAGPAAASAPGTVQPPVPPVTSSAAANWALGRQLLADGHTQDAVAYLHLAYRAEPDEPAVALDFQQALAAAGAVGDAIGVLDRLIAAHPDSLDWRLRRSSLQLRAGQTEKALADLEEVRNQGGATAEVLSAEAQILARMGRTGQALDVYRDGLLRLPEDAAHLYLGMADVYQQAGQTDQVPPLMEKAIGEHPRDPGLRLVLIRSLAALDRHDEALAAARQADADLPADAAGPEPGYDPATGDNLVMPDAEAPTVPVPADGFQVELADFYARQGQTDQAVAVLDPMWQAGTLGEQPSLWLARLLLGSARLEEAAGLVATINDRWPSSARGWFLRGRLAENRGDWPAAVTFHRKAAGLAERDPEIRVALVRSMLVAFERELTVRDPDAAAQAVRDDLEKQALATLTLIPEGDSQGQLVLGYAFRALGQLDRAAERFGLAADDKGLRRTALIQQSICLDESGHPGKARQALETLHRDLPDDPEVANSLGYFLAEKNEDLDKAATLVGQALAAEPGNGAYLDSMGWVLHRQGKQDEALDHLIRAVNVLPEDPVILEHLGAVLQALGQFEQASATFARALAAGGDPARLEPAIAAADSALGRRP